MNVNITNISIERVECTIFLGAFIDNTFTYKKHISNVKGN